MTRGERKEKRMIAFRMQRGRREQKKHTKRRGNAIERKQQKKGEGGKSNRCRRVANRQGRC